MAMGGAALILLPLLISGYLFNLIFYPLRYFSGKAEGQKLFFMAAGSGLALTFIVFGLSSLEASDIIRGLADSFHRAIPLPHSFRATLTLVASVGAAFFLNAVLWAIHQGKRQSTAKWVYSWMTESFGSSIAQLLRRAAEEQRFVMLTLKSRKIYCGRIREAPTDTERDDVCVEIVPLFSSYRDKDSLRMGERTEYPLIELWAAKRNLESRRGERTLFEARIKELGFDIEDAMLQKERSKLDAMIRDAECALAKFGNVGEIHAEDWIKVIPLREIESASFYDADAYRAWFSARTAESPAATTPASEATGSGQ